MALELSVNLADSTEMCAVAHSFAENSGENASGEPVKGKTGKALILPLNGIYFDQIASGEKVEEFRLQTDFWRKRLEGREFSAVVLTRGYPKGGGVEGVTRLTRAWRGYRETQLAHPHFGPEPVDVFAIDVSTDSHLNGDAS